MNRTLLIVAVVGLVTLAGCGAGIDTGQNGDEPPDGADIPTVSGELEFHHIDVGQADATLLVTPGGETILIDTGDWRPDGEDVIDYLDSQGIDRIDHLIATHAHADHIGGHAAVIEHVEENGEGVGAAYDSGVAHTSQTYDNYLDAIEEYDVTLFEVAEGDDLPLEGGDENETVNGTENETQGVTATFLNPPAGDSGSDLHDNSVALAVEFGDFSYLTTGDAETDAEERLADEQTDHLPSTAYQAGHHGSTTSSTPPFLDAVDPELAIISSALESQYGHPHDEVLESFGERGIETYWTAAHGDIVLTTDGEDVAVSTAADAPTDPAALLELKHEANEEASQLSLGAVPTVPSLLGPELELGPGQSGAQQLAGGGPGAGYP
ncbi:beta-lactamase domain-containing protein [Natrialba hulunbeirensis JCM 10989]|uniref:Beta-lactamase domain-containing protein n=1 Tax=Natrialba hulunbeirensis JCM 10989 TaxID=1227493 RepID=M0A649_9EURY|nr:ComEC/Rec2 family competence protein [Natrialba hulunbeirensis]ELY93377.1 beta-lactamase domain-containing protein [Natrialba hulunbeirensis JCM 10989]